LFGIYNLFRDLKSSASFDQVIDLHSVLRTWILNALFRLSGTPVSKLNKGRHEKKKLIKGSIFNNLKSTFERYLESFNPINPEFKFPSVPVFNISSDYKKEADLFIKKTNSKNSLRIGLAPFTLHRLKTWPIDYTRELLKMIEEKTKAIVFLFGGGPDETSILSKIALDYKRCYNMAGELSLGAEIALMQDMAFMITMDSSNMHLSALAGVKTITIWGATHPYAGFEAYQQEKERNFQISKHDLSCRPCTVFGKGNCKRNDFACMQWLTPQLVFEKLKSLELISVNDNSNF
jgi:ADP-heptose:LPS heptosyltransferase